MPGASLSSDYMQNLSSSSFSAPRLLATMLSALSVFWCSVWCNVFFLDSAFGASSSHDCHDRLYVGFVNILFVVER